MPQTLNLALIPGDGIGTEVVAEAMKVLTRIAPAAGLEVTTTEYDLGARRYNATGELLPDSVVEELRSYDARSAQNRPIILQIDQGDFNHAVTFERVADKKVFFRDPYGELRSMPEDQFKTFVVGMNAPKDANIIS